MPPGRPRSDTPDRVRHWIEQVTAAETALKIQQRKWANTLAVYRGFMVSDGIIDRSDNSSDTGYIDVINYMKSIISRMLPRYYYREPDISVRARIKGDPLIEQAAKGFKEFLQQEHRFLRVGRQTRGCVLDALLFYRGWMKIGYQAVFDDPKRDIRRQIGAAGAALPRGVSPKVRRDLFKEMNINEEDVEFDERFAQDSLFSTRLPAYTGSVLIDPSASTIEEVEWMAHRISVPKHRLVASRRYERSFVEKIKDMMPLDEMRRRRVPTVASAEQSVDEQQQRQPSDWTMLYEVWDRSGGEVLVLNKTVTDSFGKEHAWSYDMRGFPFKDLTFGDDPVELYGRSVAAEWIPIIAELNEYRSQRRERVRKSVRKYVLEESSVTSDAISDLESDVDSKVVILTARDGNVTQKLHRFDPAGTVTPELSNSEALATQALSNISGISEQRRGVSGTYLTATEASIIEAAAADLEGDRVQIVSEFQTEIAAGLFSLARQFFDQETLMRTIGIQAENLYEVSPELARTSFDVEVRVGSSRFVSEEKRIRDVQQFLALGAQMGSVDGVRILKDLASMMDLPEEYVLDPTDPNAEERLLRLNAIRALIGMIIPGSGLGRATNAGNVASGGVEGAEQTNEAQNTVGLDALAGGALTEGLRNGG